MSPGWPTFVSIPIVRDTNVGHANDIYRVVMGLKTNPSSIIEPTMEYTIEPAIEYTIEPAMEYTRHFTLLVCLSWVYPKQVTVPGCFFPRPDP